MRKETFLQHFKDERTLVHLVRLFLGPIMAYDYTDSKMMIEEVRSTLARQDLALQIREVHTHTEYIVHDQKTIRSGRYAVKRGVRQEEPAAMALFVKVFDALLAVGGEENRRITHKFTLAISATLPSAQQIERETVGVECPDCPTVGLTDEAYAGDIF